MAPNSGSDLHKEWNKVVGNNVRIERTSRGHTQEGIARALGISYQQVQKYETGMNRISCGRLYEIAKLLKMPVGQLFVGCAGGDDMARGSEPEDTRELRDNYALIEDPAVRATISGMVKSLSSRERGG